MSDNLGDEWLAHLWWRDWIFAWEQLGLALDEWARLYEPFMRRP